MRYIYLILALLLGVAVWLLRVHVAGGEPVAAEPQPSTGSVASNDVRFTAARIAKLREQVAEVGQVPESTPDGWTKSRVDPMKILALFPALHMREGYILRAYQFKEEGNGNGVVWGMSIDAEFPEPDKCPRLESHLLKAPKPYDALDDVMDAIAGDGSAAAYLQASLLRRELKDFGALRHGIVWGTHVVVDADPLSTVVDENADPMTTPRTKADEWRWLEAKPADWMPRVTVEGDRAVVTFYTFSGFEKEGLYRHVDVYRRDKYRPRVEEAKIAEGKTGFVF